MKAVCLRGRRLEGGRDNTEVDEVINHTRACQVAERGRGGALQESTRG